MGRDKNNLLLYRRAVAWTESEMICRAEKKTITPGNFISLISFATSLEIN
jgi:hypothetical protein